ncbi:hypothetical protein A7971_13220 [Staphylococcus argenteus]|nr:hypothetical protein A7971_13220 [Staphylococcus argenteus]OXE86500.1 hypothetical protein ATC11_04345 [Staphylococcus argenteus]
MRIGNVIYQGQSLGHQCPYLNYIILAVVGPQHREIGTQFLQAMQVGVAPTQRNWIPISTGNAGWGGPNIKKYFFFRN